MTDQAFAKFAEVWSLCGEVSQTIYTATRPFVGPIVKEAGLTQPRVVSTLLVAHGIEPDAISPERIWRRYPYGPRESWAQPLVILTEQQLLEAQNDGSYRLTPSGRAWTTGLLKAFYTGLAGIEKSIEQVYPHADFERLDALLTRIVTACFKAPIDLPGLIDSHGLAPNGAATCLARIDQALDDLNAFRDDAHLAAWQPRHIAGHTWELLTFLWRGEVKNADEMAETVAARGHTREAYQSALGDLIGRGWVRVADGNAYEVTEAGRQVREEVERLTDDYFFTPWKTMKADDVTDLKQLLAQLKTALTQRAEAVPA